MEECEREVSKMKNISEDMKSMMRKNETIIFTKIYLLYLFIYLVTSEKMRKKEGKVKQIERQATC